MNNGKVKTQPQQQGAEGVPTGNPRKKEVESAKEKSYKKQMSYLKSSLDELERGDHMRQAELGQDYRTRTRKNIVAYKHELQRIDRESAAEVDMSLKEFEKGKSHLKESFIARLEEEKRKLEENRYSMEYLLTMKLPDEKELQQGGGSSKPASTSSAIRRPQKKKKNCQQFQKSALPAPALTLSSKEIEEDLKALALSIARGPPEGLLPMNLDLSKPAKEREKEWMEGTLARWQQLKNTSPTGTGEAGCCAMSPSPKTN